MGRHLRHAARRAGAGAVAIAVALAAPAPWVAPPAGALGLLGATIAVVAGVCRLLAAHDLDTAEQRWLRHVLAELDPGEELPPLPPRPPRAARRSVLRALLAAAAVLLAGAVLTAVATPVAGAVSLVAAVLVLTLSLPRVLAAHDPPGRSLAPAYLSRP